MTTATLADDALGGDAILARPMGMQRPSPSEVGDLQDRRDRQLIERVAGGDEGGFAELFRRYSTAANGLAYRILGDQGMAEEVIQEVFLSVWRRAHSYDATRGGVRSWLLTQVHHRAVDVVRREEAARRRTTTTDPERAAGEISPDDVVEEEWLRSRRDKVQRALTILSEDQRAVIELAYFGGMTQSQVAERIQVPLGTVKSRTLAAMRALRRAFVGGEDD